MEIDSSVLFIEINNSEYNFAVCEKDKKNNFKVIFKNSIPLQGIKNYKITDLEIAIVAIKKNIYLIEQKLNTIFKETVLILDNLNRSFISLTGYKKLNGSQILKENITYILNSLKSSINKFEKKKTILHIFNSKYTLDKKKIENLPIGLFGDFYAQELSFCLINNNDFKNLNNIFNKCNLKIKKVLLKSFVEGVYLSNKNLNLNTFFQVSINHKQSKLFYFENDALKFEQNFNFGSDLVISDISKVIGLSKENVKKIIATCNFSSQILDNELVEEEFFKSSNFRKIKKKLILDVAAARIEELSELMISKNSNVINYTMENKVVFLNIYDQLNLNCFKDGYELYFSKNNFHKVEFITNISNNDLMINTNNLTNYGWKKEVIPVIQSKKSLIARVFNAIFS